LHRIGTQSADADHTQHPPGRQRTSSAEFLDAPIGRQSRVGQWRELLGLETFVNLDEIASGNRHILGISTIRTKPRPATMRTDLRIAYLTMTASAISPSANYND